MTRVSRIFRDSWAYSEVIWAAVTNLGIHNASDGDFLGESAREKVSVSVWISVAEKKPSLVQPHWFN